MNMLPTHFRSDKFDFEQIAREGKIALFRKTKGKIETYEVVIVQTFPATTLPSGKTYPEREGMPSSGMWGKDGWSLGTLERAWEKFRELK